MFSNVFCNTPCSCISKQITCCIVFVYLQKRYVFFAEWIDTIIAFYVHGNTPAISKMVWASIAF